jgi:hypothetical protein
LRHRFQLIVEQIAAGIRNSSARVASSCCTSGSGLQAAEQASTNQQVMALLGAAADRQVIPALPEALPAINGAATCL